MVLAGDVLVAFRTFLDPYKKGNATSLPAILLQPDVVDSPTTSQHPQKHQKTSLLLKGCGRLTVRNAAIQRAHTDGDTRKQQNYPIG